MLQVVKWIVYTILFVVAIIYWLSRDEEEWDAVTIEYKCSMQSEYTNVPDEVKEECAKRDSAQSK
jgi:hypothetical protein